MLSTCLSTIFIIIIFSLIIYLLKLYKSNKSLAPGPQGFPVFGYLPFLNRTQPYVTLTDLSEKYGKIYGIYLGNVYTIVLTDVNLIREVLSKKIFSGRAPLYVTHGIMGGYGIICAEGELWKDQRKLSIDWLKKMGMTKMGTSRNHMEKRIMTGVQECLNWIEMNQEQYYDLNPMIILHHTLGNILNDFVFGEKYEQDDDTWKYLQRLQEEGVKHIGISGIVNFLPLLRFLPSNTKIIKFLLDGKTKTHKIYDKIINKHSKKINNDEQIDLRKLSIIDCFLQEKLKREQGKNGNLQYCNREQLKHLLADLFGAGVDTTLATLRWFLLYIARSSDIQNEIHKEMSQKLKTAPTLDDWEELTYLRACISETQRIRSVVPLGIPHGSLEETKLCDYKIPKNTMLIPLQWAVHMNPKIWPKPDTFNPLRFIDENDNYFAPKDFIPFQTGNRMCLGDEFAKMLLYLFTSNILYKYKIELSQLSEIDMTGHCGITLTPPEYDLIFELKK